MDQPDREVEPHFSHPIRQIILMLIVLRADRSPWVPRLTARDAGVRGKSLSQRLYRHGLCDWRVLPVSGRCSR